MNIGEVAKLSGVSSKMVRHYESIGLISKASRTDSGYRSYSEKDIHILKFIKRSREFGFSMEEIKKLLGLWRNKRRPSSEVKRLALEHVSELDQKIQELTLMRDALKKLAHCCQGDDRPDCPILDELGLSDAHG